MTGASRTARIGRAFGRAADRTYDPHAGVQAEVAAELARRILDGSALLPDVLPAVLEIGCGTGFLAEPLLASRRFGPYLCTDLSPAMLLRCRARLARADLPALHAVMDAEGPAVAGPFDLVASSMALQWTADLGRALAGLGRLVRPAGRLALAVPGAETFREWRAALQGRACGVPDFPDMDGLRRLVPPGFSADLAEERRIVDYGSALAFLRALKAMGAAQPRPGHRPLDPGALRAGLSRLDDAGPRLTWHILYAVLRKDPD